MSNHTSIEKNAGVRYRSIVTLNMLRLNRESPKVNFFN